jgi:hypothetical protein
VTVGKILRLGDSWSQCKCHVMGSGPSFIFGSDNTSRSIKDVSMESTKVDLQKGAVMGCTCISYCATSYGTEELVLCISYHSRLSRNELRM